jgi:rhomboid protease GluP
MNQNNDNFPEPVGATEPPVRSDRSMLPVVTYVLIGITTLVYLAQMGSEVFLGFDIPAFLGMKGNEWIRDGQYWRLFTPVFLHGGLLHFGVNMFALYSLGSNMELINGRMRFILIYFLSGFAGNTISFLFSDAYSLGASTALFGLVAAQAVFFFQNQKIIGEQAKRALQSVAVILVINLFIGFLPGIDMYGHLGGIAGGLSFALFGSPRLQVAMTYYGLRVVDTSEQRDVINAALMVFLIFAVLAAIGIFFPPM